MVNVMTQPTFLIIGSQKAGTTSLYHVLAEHPEIEMSATKEVNFFFYDHYYQRGLSFYEQFFSSTTTTNAIGEASPGYICHPEVPARIHQALPHIKLVLTVRNPVDRAYSQYWDNRRKLSESRSFEQVFQEEFHTVYHPQKMGYFSRGFYITYIQNYLSYFPPEQLLILVTEDFKKKASETYQKIFQFLEVDASLMPPNLDQRYNVPITWGNPLYQLLFRYPAINAVVPFRLRRKLYFGAERPFTYPPLEPQLRQTIRQQYQTANQQLATLLGRDLSHW